MFFQGVHYGGEGVKVCKELQESGKMDYNVFVSTLCQVSVYTHETLMCYCHGLLISLLYCPMHACIYQGLVSSIINLAREASLPQIS